MHTRLFLLLTLSLILSRFSHADTSVMSAKRDPSVPWQSYMERATYEEKSSSSALSSARYYTGANIGQPTKWESTEFLNTNFINVRNDRYLGPASFKRRIPWLYADDGCFNRALLVNAWMKAHDIPSPGKVFAFGKLKTYSPLLKHTSYWWYHTAPIVLIGDVEYVIDPSINPAGPLPLHDWLASMGDPAKMKVSVCGSGTYVPGDNCNDSHVYRDNPSTTKNYLNREWNAMKEYGQDPDKILGDSPPW